MKITSIAIYGVELPMKEGFYAWSTQRMSSFDSTIVVIRTDEGLEGYAEICPLGPAYLPAYAEGARTGIMKLAQVLVGQNPLEIGAINHLMDSSLKGHPYVKSAIDVACWDLLGKATGQPVYNLLGGRLQDNVRLFKVVSKAQPEAMRERLIQYQEQGFKQFQMKVGGPDAALDIQRIEQVVGAMNPENRIAADANCGWFQHDAVRIVSAVAGIPVYIEQPCESYESCLVVRKTSAHPMILDECMLTVKDIIRGYNDGAMDAVNLKISRFGGITKTKLVRDLCVELGIIMTIEDTWGAEVTDAAIAHVTHSIPQEMHFQSSAFSEYTPVKVAHGGPVIDNGWMSASSAPGLGITLDWDVLGPAIASYEG